MTRFPTLVLLALSVSAARAEDLSPEHAAFFENKVRPVLVEHCYSCHSEKKDKGGLRLDTRLGTQKGGDTGPALVPGKPEASLLVKAIRYDNADIRMPPKGKLSSQQIADLTEWVKIGAPDPRTESASKNPYDFPPLLAAAKDHWAFQPVKAPTVPAVSARDRVTTPVDAFLLAKLESQKLGFAPPADKRTLIRRVTFDLHGLPPTAEEVDAFVADASPDAYPKLIEKLLASPRYGERWGRHWLDVARYSDFQGGIFGVNNPYPYAWTYRDYVVQAFNADLPYDQFVREQLAADLLPATPGDTRKLAALGFLTVGRKPDGRVSDEVIDDRIDLVSRGLLGLTAGCARCHDHKLEPIPTADYYGLYGVFMSTKDPDVLPEIQPQTETPDVIAYRAAVAKARQSLGETTARLANAAVLELRGRVGDYLLAAHDAKLQNTSKSPKVNADILAKRKLIYPVHNALVREWPNFVKKNPAVFGPWEEFAELPAAEFAAKAKPLAEKVAADGKLNPRIAKAFAGDPPKSIEDVAQRYNVAFAAVDSEWRKPATEALARAGQSVDTDAKLVGPALNGAIVDRVFAADGTNALKDADAEALRKLLIAEKSPFRVRAGELLATQVAAIPEIGRKEIDKFSKALAALDSHAGAPARAMVVEETKPYNGKVFIRGNPRTQGAPAPRAFFTALSGPTRKPFDAKNSGRLDLANAIVDPANPLTARVWVNRVWAWHFGTGIVRTPSDFGYRGERPTHPELLDWLAADFVAHGWSTKHLHRQIVLSAAYRQSSRPADSKASLTIDPENKLLGRANPRHLEFEPYRDAMLAVAGRLDLATGGRTVDVTKPDTRRRTVYASVDRKTLPGLFRAFDFPDPNFTSPGRTHSTLAPKALFLLNSAFVVENAKALATAVKPKSAADRPASVRALYRAVLQREPSPAEVERALKFLDVYPAHDVVVPEATAWAYGFAEYDEKAKKVTAFTPLKFAGNVVKGTKVGSTDATGVEVTNDGGKTAKAVATCRRWIAPEDGKIDVAAELSHAGTIGDGVLCRIVSSRSGLLGEWTAKGNSVATALKAVEVKKGDTLDFLTFAQADPTGDSYRWAPTISMPGREMPAMPGMAMKWDAKTNFLDPAKLPAPLGPWEELAQVLLLTAEFATAE